MEDDKVYAEKLSDKMKRLENLVNYTLEKKKPVILRIDGRSFSKFTKNLDKPFGIALVEIENFLGGYAKR